MDTGLVMRSSSCPRPRRGEVKIEKAARHGCDRGIKERKTETMVNQEHQIMKEDR